MKLINESIFIDSNDVEQNIFPTTETAEMKFRARCFPVTIMIMIVLIRLLTRILNCESASNLNWLTSRRKGDNIGAASIRSRSVPGVQ
jgi:hypothetical protein